MPQNAGSLFYDPSQFCSAENVFIAVMGITGSGKSTFVSTCTGQGFQIGHGLRSSITGVTISTFNCNGKTVHLIDTPGFDDTQKSNALVLEDIADWLSKAYACQIPLNGVIYLHPITANRVQGSALKCLGLFKKICGERMFGSIILCSTMWDKEDPQIAQSRETELALSSEFWRDMIDRGSKTFRFDGAKEIALKVCGYIINRNEVMTLALQHQLVDEKKPLHKTDAGLEIEQEILQVKQFHQQQFQEVQQNMQVNNLEAVLELSRIHKESLSRVEACEKALDVIRTELKTLHLHREGEYRDELQQLRSDSERDRVLLLEVQEQLNQAVAQFQDILAEKPTGDHRQRAPSLDGDERSCKDSDQSRDNIRSSELEAAIEECKALRREIARLRKVKSARKSKIDTCLQRLQIGLGVGGSAIATGVQIATLATTAGACIIM